MNELIRNAVSIEEDPLQQTAACVSSMCTQKVDVLLGQQGS